MIGKKCCRGLCCFFLFGLIGFAYADEEESEDITRSLTMKCDYSDYKTFQYEAVTIAQTEENQGKPASVRKFERRKAQPDNELFIVRPGQFAECIYPSGTRVRVKVGEGSGRPYGECGADPEVFMSLWVNKRKIVSRLWFAGHCSKEHGNPAVSFNISSNSDSVSVQKCHTAINTAPESDRTKEKTSEPLSVCVDFPDISKQPKDILEYPGPGKKPPKVGDIEILKGSDAVCHAVLNELKRDFFTFSNYPDESKAKLSRPNWNATKVKLPEVLSGCSESIFDFNNDGKLDRVFSRSYESNYMDGSVLLVQYGRSSSKLIVSGSPMDKTSSFLPCQMGKVQHNIYDCPLFSQKNDEAGFSMSRQTHKDSVYFRARYSTVTPFFFQGVNFVGVSSRSEDTQDFVAVLKPLPNKTFQKKCLLRRIQENF